ncbi:MAG TPA: DUF2723 domain-containing protein, partial [Chloroflexi bacterium]|nr:DUF2723 domain-containing protein [Chloroflexota bacterium]
MALLAVCCGSRPFNLAKGSNLRKVPDEEILTSALPTRIICAPEAKDVRASTNPSPARDLTDWLIGAGLFLASLLLYLRTLAPSVATIFDDSLEFQLVCFQPGIAHPPGYPLYTLLGKLFTFLPVGDVAYRVNLMSAVFGALTVALVYATLRQLTDHRLPAILGASVLAVSPVFWSQSVIAEVYTLNAAFVAGVLCLLLAWANRRTAPSSPSEDEQRTDDQWLYAAALLYGLSLTHHRTMVLLAPVIFVFLLIVDRRIFTRGRFLAKLILLALLPCSLYLYIPLRASVMSSQDQSYQSTLHGFLNYVTASAYVKMFVTENPVQEARTVAFYFNLLRAQITWAGIALATLGLAGSFRRSKIASLLVLSFAIMAVFVAGYNVPDIEVFMIPLFLISAAWIGNGLAVLWDVVTWLWERRTWPGRPRLRRALYVLLLAAGFLLPLHLWRAHRAENDLSRRWEVHDYGVDMLSQPLEQNATVVGILGEMTLINYFQQTEGLRPELVTISANRENRRLEEVRAQTQAGHAVYLTRPLPGVAGEYHLSSLGPLIRVRERPAALSDTPSHPLSVPFGNLILLGGYDAYLRDLQVGQSLRVTLYWQAVGKIAENYKVSVRLVDGEGHLAGAAEAFPVRDAYRTTSWRSGETVVDTYDLPILAGVPPGEYTIQVTMYEPNPPEPLASAEVGSVALPPTLGLKGAGPWDVQHRPLANLGDRIELLGYSLFGGPFKPGDHVPLTFLWQALGTSDQEYTLLLWLDDDGGWPESEAVLALSARYPPDHWQVGEVVRDWQSFLIPGNAVAGRYHLRMQ